jgi:hypothetical protein
MSRSLRTLCALLVVVATLPVATPFVGAMADDGSATTAAPAQVQPVSGRNTTSVLLLSGDATSGYASSTVDIAPTLTATRGAVDVQFHEEVVKTRLRGVTTVDERRQVLRQETERLAAEVEALQRTERRALARYQRGDASAEELLRTLAAVDAEARQATELVSLLQDEAAQVQFLSTTEDRLQTLQVELAALRGPVRSHARAVFGGEEPPTRVHVTASDDAVALALIRGNTYVREATVPGNVDSTTSDSFGSESEVIDRIGTVYPWAWTSGTSSVRTYTNFENGFYRITVDHTHGQLTSYLDGSTQNVFSEVQYKSLSRTPPGRPTVARENETALRVNQSFGGGPVQITASTVETGDPVDGTVYLDGERVGRTVNGRLWVVGPGGEYEVTVRTDRGNVTATARPVQ